MTTKNLNSIMEDIQTLADEYADESYHRGIDEAWDEARDNGYDEGWYDAVANAVKKDAYDKTSAYDDGWNDALENKEMLQEKYGAYYTDGIHGCMIEFLNQMHVMYHDRNIYHKDDINNIMRAIAAEHPIKKG